MWWNQLYDWIATAPLFIQVAIGIPLGVVLLLVLLFILRGIWVIFFVILPVFFESD